MMRTHTQSNWQLLVSVSLRRAFAIDDHIEVKNAELFNGMLKIALERLIPEEKKPKKITVKSAGKKQLLTEEV